MEVGIDLAERLGFLENLNRLRCHVFHEFSLTALERRNNDIFNLGLDEGTNLVLKLALLASLLQRHWLEAFKLKVSLSFLAEQSQTISRALELRRGTLLQRELFVVR